MAPKPCAKYQYVVTSSGPKILPVDEPSCKDEESPADYNAGGYLPVKVGDSFSNNRYRVVRKLGWGHFSTVWLVKDAHTHRHSALKVVKSAGRYAETARDEIKLLSRVSSFSPTHPGRQHIVSFLDSFSHQGPEAAHVCIIFEPLGENLLALIERNKKKGVPRPLVKAIAKQILLGLEYLHDECDLVHTDIKPENILISIPDIEEHIHNELTLSPSPTSRRVGVPLPAKSRSGVSIPQNQRGTTRRQVQIFNSQPLSSPKSATRSSIEKSMHRLDISGASQSSNYLAQMQASRTGSAYITTAASNLNSSASVPNGLNGLSSSAPNRHEALQQQSNFQIPPVKGVSAIPARFINTPSTSSSSSSVSSALASTTAGSSSLVSTPPTSLSHSLTHAVMEFMGSGKFEAELRTGIRVSPPLKSPEDEREGLVILPKKARAQSDVEKALSKAMSTSWKAQGDLSGSWKDKTARSMGSSGSPTKLSKRSSVHGHSRSHSGLSSGFWKDPGAAAPAPAVLVSAVVGADGLHDNSTKLSTIHDPIASDTSSVAPTVRPSPVGTPQPNANKRSSILIDEGAKSTHSDYLAVSGIPPPGSSSYPRDTTVYIPPHPNPHQNPSLLTQTAPRMASPSKRTNIRNSPPQQVSQLSAHMHMHKSTIQCVCPASPHPQLSQSNTQVKARSSRLHDVPLDLSTIVQVSVTPTPTSPEPSAPPPTPIDCVATSSLIPPPIIDGLPSTETPKSLLYLQTISQDKASPVPPISIKIADLGNATPSKKHYTEDIQTRQYRAPEAILGRKDWDARADIWSVACVVFELLTAEYLFDPQGQGELFTKDDDHMAQIIELMGDFPLAVKMGGKYSRELFDHTGALRYIRTLKPWPLRRVMTEKYLFLEPDSEQLCQFLEPMLATDMRERAHARDMKNHSWLEITSADGVALDW